MMPRFCVKQRIIIIIILIILINNQNNVIYLSSMFEIKLCYGLSFGLSTWLFIRDTRVNSSGKRSHTLLLDLCELDLEAVHSLSSVKKFTYISVLVRLLDVFLWGVPFPVLLCGADFGHECPQSGWRAEFPSPVSACV